MLICKLAVRCLKHLRSKSVAGLLSCLAFSTFLHVSDADARRLFVPRPAPVVHKAPIAPKAAVPLPPAEPFPMDASAKSELVVGGLHAKIDFKGPTTVVPVGGTAIVTVTITDGGGNKSVMVTADAEVGEVVSITGKGVKPTPIAGGLSTQIALPANGPTEAIVALAVKQGSPGPDGKLRSRLRLALAPQLGGRDETILPFALADCAGNYKNELSKIIGDRRAQMMGTLDWVAAPEADWPANWLFPPAKLAPAISCTPRRGKIAASCRATPGIKAQPDQATTTIDDARMLEFASQVQRQRGALPQFQHRTQPLRQASYTMLNSLRMYMEQDANPALCNGVDYMLDYYRSRTGLLRKTIDEAKTALDRARQLLATRMAEVTGAPSAQAPSVGLRLASNEPAAMTAAPAAPGPVDPTLADLADQVGQTILSAADVADLKSSPDIWSKLRKLKAFLDGPAAAALPPERRSAAVAALGMIEAVQYLGATVPRYERLDAMIYGTMSVISDAHQHSCVCSY